jgi:hypothetical protein
VFLNRAEAEKGTCITRSGYLVIEDARGSGLPRLAEQVAVKILDGTVVELEAANALSSRDVRTGDAIQFRVACPMIVDGMTLIAAGTMATGVVTEAEKCSHCGQLGKITWNVKELLTVDGTPIPLQLSVSLIDTEHSRTDEREMAAASLMFPVPSLALSFFTKERNDTVIRSGQCFRAFVRGDINVRGPRVKNEGTRSEVVASKRSAEVLSSNEPATSRFEL